MTRLFLEIKNTTLCAESSFFILLYSLCKNLLFLCAEHHYPSYKIKQTTYHCHPLGFYRPYSYRTDSRRWQSGHTRRRCALAASCTDPPPSAPRAHSSWRPSWSPPSPTSSAPARPDWSSPSCSGRASGAESWPARASPTAPRPCARRADWWSGPFHSCRRAGAASTSACPPDSGLFPVAWIKNELKMVIGIDFAWGSIL